MLGDWTEEIIAYQRDAVAHGDYYAVLAQKLALHLPEQAHVCDAGCGMGELSLALEPYCAHITAVDCSERAIACLRERAGEKITVRCAALEDAAPETPYDAMVFCLFGDMEQTLALAAKQCGGTVLLIKRDTQHHYFSAGGEALGRFSADYTEQFLRERGIPFASERFAAEFGQPLRSLEAAECFFALYNRSRDRTFTREEIAEKLQKGPSAEFPYYLPHEKHLRLFVLSADAVRAHLFDSKREND